MELAHIKLQFNRLKRHYEVARVDKDPISFLDLAHCLRIWVDMKSEVDAFLNEQGTKVDFRHTVHNRKLKELLKGTSFTVVPISSEVDSPDIKIKGLMMVNRILTAEERTKLFEMGPPRDQPTNLTFSQWLGAEIIETVVNIEGNRQRLGISREILIKRIANILGASHPQGKEDFSGVENRFDPYVKNLHQYEVADGYPLTYYQLLEIAGEMIRKLDGLIAT